MRNENWIDLTDMKAVAIAQSKGWEIDYKHMGKEHWQPWGNTWWQEDSFFRGRPLQQKMKEVKMLCWFTNGVLFWRYADEPPREHWIRQPHLDMVAQVPE